jgi:putative inorganic carbon (hco3(-)) transporter
MRNMEPGGTGNGSALHEDLLILGLVIALGTVAAVSPLAAVLGLGVALAAVVWRHPRVGLELGAFLVLVVRPSLDTFSERRLGIGPLASNPSVALGLLILFLGSILFLWRGSIGKCAWPDQWLWRAHVPLLGAYGIAILSGARLYGLEGVSEGAREGLRVLSVLAAFLVVWWWASTADARLRGWAYLLAGAVLPISVSLWQLESGKGFSDIAGVYRIQGTFSHPNAYSQYLVPLILVAVSASVFGRSAFRFPIAVAGLLLTVLLALTYARTAILSLVMGLVSLPLLQLRRLRLRALVRVAGVLGGFAVVAWLVAGNVVRERFATLSLGRGAIEAAQMGESEDSFQWRLLNWGILIRMGMEHPVTGHGAGMTTVLNPLVSSDNGVPFNAHDDFVRFFFEGGIVALILYALYVIKVCHWAIRRAAAVASRDAATSWAIAASFLTLFMLTAGTTEVSLQTADLYELYGMLALLAAVPLGLASRESTTDASSAISTPFPRSMS